MDLLRFRSFRQGGAAAVVMDDRSGDDTAVFDLYTVLAQCEDAGTVADDRVQLFLHKMKAPLFFSSV